MLKHLYIIIRVWLRGKSELIYASNELLIGVKLEKASSSTPPLVCVWGGEGCCCYPDIFFTLMLPPGYRPIETDKKREGGGGQGFS